MDMASVFAAITKTAPQDDGSLLVHGKATGSDLDLDQQRCDPEWLKRAMPEWFRIGNVREGHDARRAVGKAIEHEASDDGHYITAKIVDPLARTKVEAGVLSGFSIGIKNPRITKGADAPNGVISDGQIVEVSLVDRPCLPTATFTMAKAAKPGMQVHATDFDADRNLVRCEELVVDKAVDVDALDARVRKLTETEVDKAIDELRKQFQSGDLQDRKQDKTTVTSQVLVDGQPLEAVKAETGDAGFDRDAAKALVVDVLTKASDSGGGGGDMPPEYDPEQSDIRNAQSAISTISKLIVSEAQEMVDNPAEDRDIQILLSAVCALRCFICREQEQAMGADVVNGNGGGESVVVQLAADADAVKAKYSADQLRAMLGRGQAIRNESGDPSYPIADKEDLSNAIHAVGRGGGSHDRIRAYIIRRAKALGASSMIPDNWSSGGGNKGGSSGSSGKAVEPDEGVTTPDNNGGGTGGDGSGGDGADPDEGKTADTDAKTADDKTADNEAAWAALQKHADELGLGVTFVDTLDAAAPKGGEEKTTGTDTDKAVTEDNADGEVLVKALSSALEKADNPLRKNFEALIESSTKTIAETVREQGERLVKVENMAVPGGPALRRSEVERAQSRKTDLEGEIVRYKALASATTDPMLRKGYTQRVTQMEAEIRAL